MCWGRVLRTNEARRQRGREELLVLARRCDVYLVFGLTVLLVATFLGGTAGAAHVDCGDEITQSVTLDSDLGPCPEAGLIVTASGITVNLNGHRIVGANDPFGDGGIDLRNVTGVTVTNGTISNFDAGVVIRRGSRNVLSNLTIRENVGNSLSCDLGDGIVSFNSNDNVIRDNIVELNGPLSGIAIVGPSTGNRITGNVVRDNNLSNANCGNPRQDIGIRLEGPGAIGNKVDSNVVQRNGLAGIAVHSTVNGAPTNNNNTISDNTVTENGIVGGGSGIVMLPNGPLAFVARPLANTVKGNSVRLNGTDGIQVGNGSTDNSIVSNHASGNIRYDGSDFNLEPACDNNSWVRNSFLTVNQPCVAGNPNAGPKKQQTDEPLVDINNHQLPPIR